MDTAFSTSIIDGEVCQRSIKPEYARKKKNKMWKPNQGVTEAIFRETSQAPPVPKHMIKLWRDQLRNSNKTQVFWKTNLDVCQESQL